MNSSKLTYLQRSLGKYVRGIARACPSCGAAAANVQDVKYFVTRLCRCSDCGLLYRVPTTSEKENEEFYQQEYEQGFTTELPDDEKLNTLLSSGFKGSPIDYAAYVDVLEALGGKPGERLLDFGCSWGYGSYQLMRAGYTVKAFEISRPRCRYAREKLGVDAVDSMEALGGPFDIFFSCHVLEHVPSVADTIAFAWRVLRHGGLFIGFTPNGTSAFRREQPEAWHQSWGEVHPQILDEVFCRAAFPSSLLLASPPYDPGALRAWSGDGCRELNTGSGGELLIASRKARG